MRKARLSLVALLVTLFMVSCVTWIVQNKLKLMYENQTSCDETCHLREDQTGHLLCSWFSVLVSINCTSFNVACWLFAMRYWTLSKILELANQGKKPDLSKIKKYNLVMWIGLAINFSVSMLYGYLIYSGANTAIIYVVLPLLWISSFSFLLDGLRRIKKVMKELSDRVVIFSAFLLQSTTCGIFILGQIPNLIYALIYISDPLEYRSDKSYSTV